MTEIENGQVWRHKKRGGLYEIVATDASMQISCVESQWLEDEDFIVYRAVNGHHLFLRLREEFLDGRFELSPQSSKRGSE